MVKQKSQLTYQWNILPQPDVDAVQRLMDEINVSRPIATLLVQRQITNFQAAKKFFRPSLDDLHNPFLMKDMDIAVERIQTAMSKGEKILFYGDYDVDGTTAVAFMLSFFKRLYDSIDFYIPDRYSEGYGVSFQGIDYAEAHGFSLIISLDCGIKAVDKVKYAKEKNIDFIICDHHLPGDELPDAVAILDPKQPGCKYPYKELSGCGVGFKLAQAFAEKHQIDKKWLYDNLDLLAVSIACDIVPITGENRILAFHGLKKINTSPRKSIAALLNTAKTKKEITISDLVFIVGPRINAAGRIDHAKKAVQLLASDNHTETETIAQIIHQDNQTRKDLDSHITQEALQLIEENPLWKQAKSLVLYKEDWHKGVIGIVASRIIEHYYKPTIILTKSKDVVAGSARSVKGFNVYKAIEECSDCLIQFGGHKYAAGLTLKEEQIEAFREKFEQSVCKTITPEQLIPVLDIDILLNFDEITPNFFKVLKQMAPFGPGNMRPLFASKEVYDYGYSKAVGEDGSHLRLVLKQKGNQQSFTGIAFNKGYLIDQIQSSPSFSIAYKLEENTWNGNTSIQMKIEDIKFEK